MEDKRVNKLGGGVWFVPGILCSGGVIGVTKTSCCFLFSNVFLGFNHITLLGWFGDTLVSSQRERYEERKGRVG